jgi:diguanylate cyclase (GGDEF)-like protein
MKILVAEDDSVTRRLLRVALERWNYEVIAVGDGAQAREALFQEGAPKLAILDWVMPGADGIEICRELRQRKAGTYIYTLVLTAKREKGDLLEGLDAGADDFLIKPFDPLELHARLRSGCRIIELQDQLIAAREAMRDQATRDALTTVWNRAAVMEILQRELARSSREELPMSLMMADLDHFKRINDSMGHQTGDAVLQEVARRIQSVLRPYDVVGRYGGEEFLLVAPGCDGSAALSLAEKIRARVLSTPVLTLAGPVPVTLTLGVASYTEDSSLESLLRSADDALYRGKEAGRNRSELAAPLRFGSIPPQSSRPRITLGA